MSSTRGDDWKFAKPCCKDSRLYFFSLRVLNRWNSLSQDLVDSVSVNSIKFGLERLRSRKRIYIVPFSSEPATYKALLLVRGKPRLQPKLGQ